MINLRNYLSQKMNSVFKYSNNKKLYEEIQRRSDKEVVWNEVLNFYFLEKQYLAEPFTNYLFERQEGAKLVFAFFEEQCGKNTDTADLEKMESFLLVLKRTGLDLKFLRSISEVFYTCLSDNPTFGDYERILKYCLLFTWKIKTKKLPERYFDNFFFVLRMAGDKNEIGRAYKGKSIVQNFAGYMPNFLVKYIVTKKNICFSDKEEMAAGYRLRGKQIDWLVEYSSLPEEEKNRGLFINNYYFDLHIGLQKIVEAWVLKEWHHDQFVYQDPILQENRDIIQVLLSSNEKRKYLWCEKSVVDTWWRYRLLSDEKSVWEWKVSYEAGTGGSPFQLNIWEMRPGRKEEPKRFPGSFQMTSRELINQISDQMSIHHYLGTEVVGLWHESLYNGRIPERCLSLTGDISIEKAEGYKFIFKKGQGTRPNRFFYLDRKVYGNINNISAVVGKNGSGKTSSFRLICQDGPYSETETCMPQYVIFYKMNGEYYYSTNVPKEEVQIVGIDRDHDMTEDRKRRAVIVYFTNVLSLYQQNGYQKSRNFIDLSNSAIWRTEVSSPYPGRKYQDVIRELKFLNDLYESFRENKEKLEEIQRDFRINAIYIRFPDYIVQKVPKDVMQSAIHGNEEHEPGKDILEREIKIDGLEKIHDVYRLCESAWKAEKGFDKFNEMRHSAQMNIFESDFCISIPYLSSGQQAKLELYSRLHSLFEEKRMSGRKDSDNSTFCGFEGTAADNYILLLDEIESYLHPEWQRCFVYELISFLEWENRERVYENVQVILSSNSPFFMSDIPSGNICVLYRGENEAPEDRERIEALLEEGTFAQNIHRIMKSSFFMDNGLMGKFAQNKLDWSFKKLEEEGGNDDTCKKEIGYIIGQTGEPLLKNALNRLYTNKYAAPELQSKSERISEILAGTSKEEREYILAEIRKGEFS